MSGWRRSWPAWARMSRGLPLEFFVSHATFDVMTDQLKLLARSEDDLKVVSSVLQDAVLKVGDIAWLPDQHRFAAVLNRYRWERGSDGGRGERIRTGLHFDHVLATQSRFVPRDDPDHVMELLAVEAAARPDDDIDILLKFAGYATIRLHADCIDLQVRDLTGPWKARRKPEHLLD